VSDDALRLRVTDDRLAVCRLGSTDPIPDWAAHEGFCSITRTPAELSLVVPEACVPEGTRAERGWRCLEVAGPLDFGLVGVLARLTAPLAAASVSVFVVSTFDTDYVLSKSERLERGIAALRAAGHTIDGADPEDIG